MTSAYAQTATSIDPGAVAAESVGYRASELKPGTRVNLELRETERDIVRVRRGLIFSALLAPVSLGLFTAALAIDDCFFGSDDCSTSGGSAALYILGSAAFIAAPIGMIASGVRLRQHKKKRKQLKSGIRFTDVSIEPSNVSAKFTF